MLAECDAVTNGQGVFGGPFDDKTDVVVRAALPLLTILDQDPTAFDRVANHPGFPRTQRAPNKDNPLLALLFTAKPRNAAERKLVSDWTTKLEWGRTTGRDPSQITLKAAKSAVRATRRAEARASNDGDPACADDPRTGGNADRACTPEQPESNRDLPAASRDELLEAQPDPTTVGAEADERSSARAVVAAEEAARIIADVAGSTLDRLAELLERADLHHFVRTIRSRAAETHATVPTQASGQLDAEPAPETQGESLSTDEVESIGLGDATGTTPALEVASVAVQAGPDPDSAGHHTVPVARAGSRGTTASDGSMPDLPDFLRRTASNPLCCQPLGSSPTQSAPTPSSAIRSSPAEQPPIRKSGADRAPNDLTDDIPF